VEMYIQEIDMMQEDFVSLLLESRR